DLRAQKLHSRDVQRLPFHVDLAHVNHAFAAETRGDGRSGNAVLAGAGLSDDAAFAHSLREKNLAERVVDFVRAGMKQILALQINFRTAQFRSQAFRKIERRWAAREITE